MDELTPKSLEQAVLDAGLEVYHVEGDKIRIAERVRVHLMDSGVSLVIDDGVQVRFTVRSQRSDFPSGSAEELFSKVRERMREIVSARGFDEIEAKTRDVTDPVDDSNVLDVWHELTYAKRIEERSALIEDVRWALALPKCVP